MLKRTKAMLLLLFCLVIIVGCGGTAGTAPTGSSGGSGSSSASSTPSSPSGSSGSSSGGGQAASTPPSGGSSEVKWPEILTFATPNQGSSGHVAATIIADVIKRKTPVRQVTVEPYSNASRMVEPLSTGEADIAFSGGYTEFIEGYYGIGDWAAKGPQNVKGLMFMYVDPWGFLTVDPNLKTFADLKGKTLLFFANNKDHVNTLDAYLEYYNMSKSDLNIIPVSEVGTAVKHLNDGNADAFLFGAAPALQEVKTKRGLYPMPVPPEVFAKVIEKEPTRLQYTLKKGTTFLAPEEDVPYMGQPGGVVARGDLDENLVYEIVKLIYEDAREALYQAKPTSEINWNPKHATEVFEYPVHEGMIRYLKEINMWTPEQEQRQQELLNKLKR